MSHPRYGRAACPSCHKRIAVTGTLRLARHGQPLSPCVGSAHPVSLAAVSWPVDAPPLQPCGTHAAHNRHKAAGEAPCALCVEGERVYQHRAYALRAALRAAWLGVESEDVAA